MTDLVSQQEVWKTKELKDIIDEVIEDPRFVGFVRYLHNVSLFWSRSIETACAGHGFIFFNPDFFDSIPPETRRTVIAHEIRHLVLKHLDRGKAFNPMDYNIAADHVINLDLEKEGFTFDGTNPCKDPKFKGMSTEEVYGVIHQKNKDKTPKLEDLNKHVSADQIEDLVEQALQAEGGKVTLDEQQAKNEKDVDTLVAAIGSQPGNAIISLDATSKIVLVEGATYQEIFEDYLIEPLGGRKRSFMRPSRRQAGILNTPFLLPGRLKKEVGSNRLTQLTYALDVSGSISKRMAQQFHDSVRSIKELLNPVSLTVLLFDTRIVYERTYSDREPYTNIDVRAGGGTCLEAVYRRTEQLGTQALVVFTDLEVDIPKKPEWDSIWIVPNSRCYIPKNFYGSLYLIPSE